MFPTPWTVLLEPYVGGVKDSHGNTVATWGDPVPHAVYGWGAPMFTEPSASGVNSEVVTLVVYGPTFPVDNRDRLIVDDVRYDVVGEASDYDHGPFGFHPGMSIALTRSA